MEQYSVSGMSCAACSARVEKAVSGVDGVTSCAVSLLTNSMGVEGTAKPEEIIAAVRDAGYDAAIKKSSVSAGAGVNYPETSTTFIDRFLAGAEAYRVPVIIVFNKCDLLTEEELRYEKMMRTLYETIGYQCVEISAATGEGVDELRPLIRDKKSLLSGNSGVGKSTLINQLIPDAGQRTAEISEAHNSGMHTTTFSEMLELPEGGYLIDTPGIKGFEIGRASCRERV